MALDGFTQLDWHLVISLWSAQECAPAVILRAQQFVHLAVARVPHYHRCWSSTRDGCVQAHYCNPRPLRRSHFSHVPKFLGACSFSSIVPHLQLFGCAQHLHFLIGWVLEHRLINTTAQRSRVRWEAAICGVGNSLFVVLPLHTSRASPASSVSFAGFTPLSPSVSRSGLPGVDCLAFAVSSTAGSSRLRQHDLLSASTWLRVLQLGFAQRYIHNVTPINSYSCHTHARR